MSLTYFLNINLSIHDVIELINKIIPDQIITALALSAGFTSSMIPAIKDTIPKINVINQGAFVFLNFQPILISLFVDTW